MLSAWGRAEGRGEHVGHGLRPEAAPRKKLCGLRRTGKKAKLRDYTQLVCHCRLCLVYRGRITVEFSYAPPDPAHEPIEHYGSTVGRAASAAII
jgi:hypothetical protein